MRILNTFLLTLVNLYVPSTRLLSKHDRVRSNEVDLRYIIQDITITSKVFSVPSYILYTTSYKEHSANTLSPFCCTLCKFIALNLSPIVSTLTIGFQENMMMKG